MKIYLVGGAVRDELLGLPVYDRDYVVVGATPEQMLAHGYTQVGSDFPVFLHPKTQEEYALARTERKSGKGYTGFECHASPEVTLEEDLLRRDLTINAIAKDEHGNIIDPYGGVQDIQQRIFRHVSPAFSEDPLRVLRLARFAARFAAFDFHVAAETKLLLDKIVHSQELRHLTPERIWMETRKALCTAKPSLYFEFLINYQALEELTQGQRKPQTTADFSALAVQAKSVLTHRELVTEQGQNDLIRRYSLAHFAILQAFVTSTSVHQMWRVPSQFARIADATVAVHQAFTTSAEVLDPSSLLAVLQQLDSFRRPEIYHQTLACVEAILQSSGRLDVVSRADFQVFRAAHSLFVDIDVQSIIAQGFSHQAIGAELNRQRLSRLQQAIATSSSPAAE
ncbi:MAG: hypothetical protein LAT77_09680 [Aliidiomarina sp.]|uniref:hypothetical protein n=1 Tax=Aliidiomarina sp. TaxID=1872439 RepID=UPI0025C1D8D0|nr:hypothetical protein [Aliidiomarina sp.]MCH8502163.1 hypothetical protein [Aliidiomarina sp.]